MRISELMLKIKQSSIIYLVINQLWQSFGIDWSGTNGYTHVIWHWGGGKIAPLELLNGEFGDPILYLHNSKCIILFDIK